MSPVLRLIRADSLSSGTAQTGGMVRAAAISGDLVGARSLWMGRTVVLPGTSSGDHHHGESETGIYVVSGHPVFVFRDPQSGSLVRLETSPGDYVWVPPHVPHREENPSADTEAVVVIARSTQEAIVVNVPALLARPARGAPMSIDGSSPGSRRPKASPTSDTGSCGQRRGEPRPRGARCGTRRSPAGWREFQR